jgi:uncharacterized membrane protein
MIALIVLIIGFLLIAPIIFAISANSGVASLKSRLREMEHSIEVLRQEIGWLRTGRDDGTGSRGSSGPSRTAPQADATAPPQSPTPQGPIPPRPLPPAGLPPAETPRPKAAASVPPVEPPPPAAPPRPAAGATPPATESFEQALGTKWAVWAGGLALAVGGLFLVRYTIDAGLLGPGVRIVMGLLLAAGLIVAGEWFRRNENQISVAALPQANIPSILTAAGTVVAFGTIYAAHALYDFIGPAFAFIALGATGIITMLAAALHGPALAGIGLAGAFASPLLVQSSTPNPWPVVLYLAVVAASALVLSRTRKWTWLSVAAVAGASIWGVALLAPQGTSGAGTLMFGLSAAAVHALLQLALVAFFLAIEPNADVPDAKAEPDPLATIALAAMSLICVLVIVTPGLGLTSVTFFATLAMAVLGATAWRSAPGAVAAVFAGVIALAVTLVWPGLSTLPTPSQLAPWTGTLLHYPENIASFMTFSALTTLLLGAGALLRIWRGSLLKDRTTALYCLAATVPPLLALVIAYLRITQFDISISFALGGAALACLFAVAAEKFHRADLTYSSPAYNMAAGACAAAAIAALAFALTASLERGYLTVALALAALGTAYVATLRDIALLRHAVTALGVIVLGRLLWDPRIMGSGVGATPIFNWLLLGYGIPAASFAGAARLLQTRGDTTSVRLCDSLAVIFAGLLAFFEVRHFTNNGDVFHGDAGHVEAGLMTLVALGMSFALARFNLRKSNPVFNIASMLAGVGAIGFASLGLLLVSNPLFSGDYVGGATVFSSLLPAYLIPGIAALFVARHTRAFRPEWYVHAAGILGVVLIATYVSLEVRHAFQGPNISLYQDTSAAEHWAHSFAWLVLGIAFLGYGLLRRSLEARIASAALIVLAALKITLFDLAGIGGIWRALSFLCLGAVLIGIGLVYQKIVFARPVKTQE